MNRRGKNLDNLEQKRISNELYVALLRYAKIVNSVKAKDVKKYKALLAKFNDLDAELKEIASDKKEIDVNPLRQQPDYGTGN